MAIRRRCRGACRSARRCLEHLWFDVKHRGTRSADQTDAQRDDQGSPERRRFPGCLLRTALATGFGVRLNTKAERVRDRRTSREEEKRLLDAALAMNTWEHKYVGPLMHDRIIGALELCCRRGEMVLIQNKRVDRDTHAIGIPGHTTKDKENRRIPFDPNGRLAAVLRRRGKLGPNAFVFGTENGAFMGSFKTAWESLLLVANGHDTKPAKPGARVDRANLRPDRPALARPASRGRLSSSGGARGLLAERVDIRTIN